MINYCVHIVADGAGSYWNYLISVLMHKVALKKLLR